VRANGHFLHLVGDRKTKPSQRRELIRTADGEQLKSICECALNVLNRNVVISPAQTAALRRHKTLLLRLVNKSLPLEGKRRMLQQQSGGNALKTLLSTLIESTSNPITAAILRPVRKYLDPTIPF